MNKRRQTVFVERSPCLSSLLLKFFRLDRDLFQLRHSYLQRGHYQVSREFSVEGSQRIRILHGRYVRLREKRSERYGVKGANEAVAVRSCRDCRNILQDLRNF